MAISQNFSNTRPSLNLNFARSKTLDPRITFSRTNPKATYVDDDGLIVDAGADEPRFDHDPTTGESLGLLVEEQRINVLLYSEEFDTGWTNTNASVTANATTAPDGTTTADKLVENSSTGNKEVNQGNITFTSGTSLTFSCFAKAAGRTRFRLAGTTARFDSGTNAWFDLSTGTVVGTSGGFTSASIEAYPNGWYRCVGTMLPTSSGTNNVYITLVNSGTTSNYTGDGSSGIFIWGAQLEAGSFPTSYIPTTNSAATRSKDGVSMTGTNFSDWYNPSEGSIYVKYNINGYYATDGFNRIFEISDGTSNNRFANLLQGTNSNIYESWIIAGSQNADYNTSSITFGDFYQIAVGFGTNLKRYTYNASGNLDINTDTSIGISTFSPTQLNIGNEASSSVRQLNGHISHLSYYPTKLSDDQLQNLILQ